MEFKDLCEDADPEMLKMICSEKPSGPLNLYRQRSSFNWKRMRLFVFGYDTLEFQV